MITTVASSFLPVNETAAAAAWYQAHLGLDVVDVREHSAVLQDSHQRRLTLLGPGSGIAAAPGLAWAPVSFQVEDVHAFRDECLRAEMRCSPVQGDPATCSFVTVDDLDGNTVLVVDR